MQLYCVVDRYDNEYWGPFTTKALANQVLEIVQKTEDPEATIKDLPVDPWAAELKAGMMPFKIGVELYPATGAVRETKVELTWPPAEKEGLVERSEVYITYFVWARNRGEAITRMARVTNSQPAASQRAQDDECDPIPAYQARSSRRRAAAGDW